MAPFQVLTLNVWGLWLVSKKRYNRILHLAEFLANEAPQKHELDVVLLQEVWVDADARVLASAAREGGLPYSMHFKSGVFGSGLLTLSRYPITEAAFHQYICAGDPLALHCGDYLAAKGVGWVRVATPGGPLDVFNTHLHANYAHKYEAKQHEGRGAAGPSGEEEAGAGAGPSEGGRGEEAEAGAVPAAAADEFAAFRMAQVLELARFVNSTAGRGGGSLGTVLGGDLNCGPHTLEAAVLRSLLPQLRDAWLARPGADPRDPGHTCKAEGNSFKPRRQQPARIDYVLTTLHVKDCRLALQRTPEGHSYSDHFAVHARLTLPTAGSPPPPASASASASTSEACGGGDTAAAPVPSPSPAAPGGGGSPTRGSLLRAAYRVLELGSRRAALASSGHIALGVIMLLQAVCICAFEPVMSRFGMPIQPIARLLVPAVASLLALGGGVFLLTGFVADCGQARALQQAAAQAEIALGAAGKAEGKQGAGGKAIGDPRAKGSGTGTVAKRR